MAKARKPKPRKRGKHKTQKPDLTRQDVKFAQLLFDRDLSVPRKSVAACYLEAGFPARETEDATIQAASRRVRNRQFREYYRRHQRHAMEEAMLTSAELVATLANIMRADRRRLFGPGGDVLPPDQWPDDVAAVVEDFDFDTVSELTGEAGAELRQKVYLKKVKTYSVLAAAVKLMEVMRMVGSDAAGPPVERKPLVVNGADTNKL